MNYYTFHIGDYAAHTNHLEPLEDLAYRRMMDWCYLHERELPNDIEEIARLIRMRTHSDCIAYVLREFFYETENGYASKRVSQEIGRYQEKSEKAKKSAEARWKNKASKIKGSCDANALQTQCEGNANQEPITNNQYVYSDDSYEVARFLSKKIKNFNPSCRKHNLDSWAKDIDKAIRIDNRTKEQLIDCINWIYEGSGNFWIPNIQSGKKLRDKFDTMFMQATTGIQQQSQNLDEVTL
jgi:uncharacterized protein YdaU (DUF1376 family)